MWRSLASSEFQPARSWWRQPFVQIPSIYLLIAGGYIVASSYFFAARLDYSAGILGAEILKGLLFVVVTSAVLALVLFRVDQRTRASRESFHDLVQSLPDAVLVLAVPERRIEFVNDACAEVFGYRSDELIGQNTKMLHVDQDHFEAFYDLCARTLERNEAYVGDFRMRRRDGTVFPSSHVVTSITNVSQRRFVVSVVRDESLSFEQRRKAEESAERLRIIGENLQEVFWIATGSGELEFISPAFEKVWGRPVRDMLRDPFVVLEQIHPADRELVAEALANAAEGYDIRYRMLRPDGEIRWIHGRAVPVRGENGRTERIVGISADVTQVVQQQEELRLGQKLRAVGELTGGVAHDFNNLLMIMMGNAEDLAERVPGDGVEQEALAEIVAAACRARDLTDSLLRFSRHQPDEPGRLDVNEAVTRIASMLARVLGRRVDVTTSLTSDECVVSANPADFETSLMNLLINSRDAMPAGGTVQVSTRIEYVGRGDSEIAQGNYVILAVADTGAGMSDTVRRRALEPFFTTKPQGTGTGLGLSLVNSFAKSAGGTLRIFSRPGKGTTLEMYLPCRPENQDDDGTESGNRRLAPAG